MEIVIVASVGVIFLLPLVYALATLRKLRHKQIYPVLRIKPSKVRSPSNKGAGQDARQRDAPSCVTKEG